MEKIRAVQTVSSDERATKVAKAWRSARGSALVVCATHDEIDRVNIAIREDRRQAGELGQARLVARDVALGWTTAPKKTDLRNFRAGLVLGFHRAVKGIERNSVVEVVRVDRMGVVVRGADGKGQHVDAQAGSEFRRV